MNTPKLRFRNYLENWLQVSLNEVSDRITTKNKDNNQNVLTISAQYGLISQLEYFNKSVSAKDVKGYYLLERNDFAYNKSYSNGYPMGAIKKLSRYEKGVVSTLYICFRNKDSLNDDFLEYYFESGKHNKQIELYAQEGARNHGLLNIGVNDFFSTELYIPSLPEQQKIASFFTAVDQKLIALKKKKELLEQYKKGVMQQIFSQKVRFKDDAGNSFPEWEEKTLGKIAQIYQPKTISQNEFSENGFDVYGANGIIGKYKEYNHLNSQIVVTCRGNTCGTINYTKPKSWITGNAMVINLDSNLLIKKKFLYYQLKNANLNYLITGSGQPQITGSIKMHKILIACYLEQQKIADFLSAIDNKIDTVAKQIDKTEQWKKGLLQKMFV